MTCGHSYWLRIRPEHCRIEFGVWPGWDGKWEMSKRLQSAHASIRCEARMKSRVNRSTTEFIFSEVCSHLVKKPVEVRAAPSFLMATTTRSGLAQLNPDAWAKQRGSLSPCSAFSLFPEFPLIPPSRCRCFARFLPLRLIPHHNRHRRFRLSVY